MARYIAKNIVAAELCDKCEVELAYAIGVAKPVSQFVSTFGTAKVPEEKIEGAIAEIFDATPAGIMETLDLRKPIFQETATYGHFGRGNFSWERTDRTDALKEKLQ